MPGLIRETVDLLGLAATDKVTGYKGVIISVSFDLFGCVQAVLKPPIDKDGKVQDGQWFDVQRLQLGSEPRVMAVPDFSAVATRPADYSHGPAEKPSRAL